MKGERLAGDWLDLLTARQAGDNVNGVLTVFADDILHPPKEAFIWACHYCARFINPGCTDKKWFVGWRRQCVRRALLRELEDAYDEMQKMESGYGLAMDLSWEEYLERMESPLRDPEWMRTGRVGEVVGSVV